MQSTICIPSPMIQAIPAMATEHRGTLASEPGGQAPLVANIGKRTGARMTE